MWLFFHHGASNWLILETTGFQVSPAAYSSLRYCALYVIFFVPSKECCAQARSQGGATQDYVFNIWVCVFAWKRSIGVSVAMHINKDAHGCKNQGFVCVFQLRFDQCKTEHGSFYFWCLLAPHFCLCLETECQTNALISLFHPVPPCPLSGHCLCLQVLLSLASFALIPPSFF